jgi:hypothetical protein
MARSCVARLASTAPKSDSQMQLPGASRLSATTESGNGRPSSRQRDESRSNATQALS